MIGEMAVSGTLRRRRNCSIRSRDGTGSSPPASAWGSKRSFDVQRGRSRGPASPWVAAPSAEASQPGVPGVRGRAGPCARSAMTREVRTVRVRITHTLHDRQLPVLEQLRQSRSSAGCRPTRSSIFRTSCGFDPQRWPMFAILVVAIGNDRVEAVVAAVELDDNQDTSLRSRARIGGQRRRRAGQERRDGRAAGQQRESIPGPVGTIRGGLKPGIGQVSFVFFKPVEIPGSSADSCSALRRPSGRPSTCRGLRIRAMRFGARSPWTSRSTSASTAVSVSDAVPIRPGQRIELRKAKGRVAPDDVVGPVARAPAASRC